MATHLDPNALSNNALDELYESVGHDKRFVLTLAEIYLLQGDEFLKAVATGVEHLDLASMVHSLAAASARISTPEFVQTALDLETNIREGVSFEAQLDYIVRWLPELMVGFEAFANGLPDAYAASGAVSSL